MNRTKRLEKTSQQVREAEAVRASRRQAQALEVIAGVMMLRYLNDADELYSAEALFEEARWHARGGDL